MLCTFYLTVCFFFFFFFNDTATTEIYTLSLHDALPISLVAAYERGLFTFAHVGPLKWVSPPERCVLFFNEIHLARKLRRQMRQGRYTVTFDRDFEAIIKACAGRRDGKWHVTWITPRIMRAYAELF